MKLTFSVRSVLRPDKIKANGFVPIYFSVRVGATTTRLPSGKFIELKKWNTKENMPKKITKAGQLLATYLQKQITDCENYLQAEENMGRQITITKAMAFFKGDTNVSLFSFWSEQLELWRNEKEDNTLKSYRSVLNMLKSFNSKLNWGDLSLDMIQKFDFYMAKVKNNSLNGRHPKHKCLKAMINQGIMKGYIKENPYRFFKLRSTEGTREHLTIDTVRILMNLEIPENDICLQRTKDYFVWSCLTGLRYSDVMNLKWVNVDMENNSITVKMTKTKKEIMIPLVSPAKAIIEKYGKHTLRIASSNVFPYVSNQVLNRRLKDIMLLAGIDQHLTFHVSRHSFASSMVQLDTNPIFIKDLLGHSKLADTLKYAKSLKSDLVLSMNKMESIYELPHAI